MLLTYRTRLIFASIGVLPKAIPLLNGPLPVATPLCKHSIVGDESVLRIKSFPPTQNRVPIGTFPVVLRQSPQPTRRRTYLLLHDRARNALSICQCTGKRTCIFTKYNGLAPLRVTARRLPQAANQDYQFTYLIRC